MKKLYLFILLFIFFISCSTNKESDKSISNNDTNKNIDSLKELSSKYYHKYSNEAIIFDKYLKQAYNKAKQTNNYKQKALIYNELGKRYRNQSNFKRAIWYHQQAINTALAYSLDTVLAEATYKQSVVFRNMNENAHSYKLCVKALEQAQHIKDTFLIHCAYNGIGNLYFNHEHYRKAISYYHKSLNFLGTENHNYLGEAINNNTLGEAWLFLGNTDSALFYLKKSLEINFQIKSKLGQAICYNGMGLVFLKEKDYKKAIEYSQKAVYIKSNKINSLYQSMFRNTLGEIYLKIDSLDLAKKYLLESFEISHKIMSKKEALDASKLLIELYTKEKKNDKISEYTQYWIGYKDSLTNNLIKQNSESMEMLYRAEKQQREIIILQQNSELDHLKINRQRNFFIFIFIILLAIIIFFIFIYQHKTLQNRLNEITLEQRLFRSQLNPHFIFNALASMQNFIVKNQTSLATDYLARFSSLMRNVLNSSRYDSILLETEIQTIEHYLKLQQLRFNDKFEFNISVSENIDIEYCFIPPMLIQPFIENSIEHGVKSVKYKCLIKINLYRDNDSLFVIIDDNGKGFNEKKTNNLSNKKHISLATTIIKERLENIKAKTKKNCSLTIINKKDLNKKETGVTIKVQIPYQKG